MVHLTILTVSCCVTFRLRLLSSGHFFCLAEATLSAALGFTAWARATGIVQKETNESLAELVSGWEGAPSRGWVGWNTTIFDLTPLQARVSLSQFPSESTQEFFPRMLVPAFLFSAHWEGVF